MAASKSLLVVGSGSTGSLCVGMIAKNCPNTKLYLWDKARGIGGRMTTFRHSQFPDQHVDLGAQYITRYSSNDPNSPLSITKSQIFEELQRNGILVPFSGVIENERQSEQVPLGHFVSPSGLSALPRYFIEQASLSVQHNHHLSHVNIDRSKGVVACQTADGRQDVFDGVILTQPVPQLLSLGGNLLEHISPDFMAGLQLVQYSSRFALGLLFDQDTTLSDITWTAKYFDNPVIRFACWDMKKRGTNLHPTLLLHSSVPFTLKHFEEDKEAVKERMLTSLKELVPHIPTHSQARIIRWRYSQVFKGYPGAPGCLVVCENPLVLITGDAMTHSNFEGCIMAAHTTANIVSSYFK